MMDFRASARGYASQHDPRGAGPPRAAGAPPEPTGRLLTDRSAYMQYLEVRPAPAPPSRPAPLDVSSHHHLLPACGPGGVHSALHSAQPLQWEVMTHPLSAEEELRGAEPAVPLDLHHHHHLLLLLLLLPSLVGHLPGRLLGNAPPPAARPPGPVPALAPGPPPSQPGPGPGPQRPRPARPGVRGG